MLIGVKEFRINRNLPEVVGNTWVDPTSVYQVKQVDTEKAKLFRLFLTQGAQVLVDEEGFQRIIQKLNG